MTKDQILMALKNRVAILEGRGDKNIKCGGVLRKLRRQIRNMEVA